MELDHCDHVTNQGHEADLRVENVGGQKQELYHCERAIRQLKHTTASLTKDQDNQNTPLH